MIRKLPLLTILILFPLISVSAIDLIPEPKLCNTLFSADFAAHIRVLKVENIFHEEDPIGAPDLKYFLDVIKVYRGKIGKELVVVSEMGKHNVSLETGKEYILFPSKLADGTYHIWTNLGEVDNGLLYSKEWDLKINDLLHQKVSIIEGEVRDRSWKPLSGAELTIRGNGTHRKVKVDEKGFLVMVVPGVYEIDIPKNLRVSVNSPNGMSSDPQNDNVAPQTLVGGQCVQILLEEREQVLIILPKAQLTLASTGSCPCRATPGDAYVGTR